MKEQKLLKKDNNLKELAMGMMAYTSVSIFGPLVFFCIIGFILDKTFDTKPIILIISLAVAFISTNLLLIKKIRNLMKKFNILYPEETKDSSIKTDNPLSEETKKRKN